MKGFRLFLWKGEEGSLLVEAIVSISIILMGLGTTLTLAAQAMRLSGIISNRIIATKLAEEGIEVVHNMIITNSMQKKPFNLFILRGGGTITDGTFRVASDSTQLDSCTTNLCSQDVLSLDARGFYGYDPTGIRTLFRRRVEITTASSNEVKVNAVVVWRETGGDAQVNTEAHFFNWR